MWIANGWENFEVLDTAAGEKLERWNKYKIIRPDPQIIWNTPKNPKLWDNPSAIYMRSNTGGGHWEINDLPETFEINYSDLTFRLKPMSFKHMGLFPEQACNWDWFRGLIRNSGRKISVLNLFAYTGAASLACAKEGASVCHIDASKGMVFLAKENAACCDIDNIRFIVDDCVKFVRREQRRGKKYDAVIMDPPSYGRGPDGEVWKIENELYALIELCMSVLSDNPLFFLLNSYTTGLSAACMQYLLTVTVAKKFKGEVFAEEIGLPVTSTGLALPCGASARWSRI